MTIETYFEKLGTTLETDAKTALGTFFGSFITTDLGALAVDAVNYAETVVDATTDDEKREAAKTALLNAAEAAGKDLVTAGTAFINFLLETALQTVMAGVAAAEA